MLISEYVLTTRIPGGLHSIKEKVGSSVPYALEFINNLCRYSEFSDLRAKLVMTFPKSAGAMPPLPRKSIIRKPGSDRPHGS